MGRSLHIGSVPDLTMIVPQWIFHLAIRLLILGFMGLVVLVRILNIIPMQTSAGLSLICRIGFGGVDLPSILSSPCKVPRALAGKD